MAITTTPGHHMPEGAGIGLRLPHLAEVVATRPAVGWLEIHPENFLANAHATELLIELSRHYPISVHTVGISIGSVEGIDRSHPDRCAPRMFGVLILDRMALGPSLGSDILGYLYHYWVGACFGLTYTLLLGRFRWWRGLVWGLIIEIGMMVTPPMVVAMDTGYFGVKFGPGLFATSLVAHVAYGSASGMLAERYVVHRGTLVGMLREKFRRLGDAGEGHAVIQPRRS